MKSLYLVIGLTLIVGMNWTPDTLSADEPLPAAEAFEKIKSLAGQWYDVNDANVMVSNIQVVSGGHSVMETLFPGTEKEMISLYHLDGDQLLMTHYCMLGNQPKFKAVASASEIRFEFAGGTNMNSDVDLHIHEGQIRFLDKDHIRSKWTPYQDGKPVEAHEFELTRKQGTSETSGQNSFVSKSSKSATTRCCAVGQ